MEKNRLAQIASGLIIILGFIARIIIYYFRLSVNGGEYVRFVALSRYSYLQILKLGHSIISAVHDPYGLLLIQKFFIDLFGDGKLSLRLVPFLCSLIALILLAKIKDWFVSPLGGLVALGLLAFAPQAVMPSASLEPYSSDICVTLLVWMLFKRMHSSDLNLRAAAGFSLAGSLCIWLSLPAIFVLTGSGLALGMYEIFRRQWQKVLRLSGIVIFWVINILGYYFYALRYFSRQNAVLSDWGDKFLPATWNLFAVFGHVAENTSVFLGYFMGIIPCLGFLLIAVGIYRMFHKRPLPCLLLVMPVLMTMAAACLQKYPFQDRVLIFLMPAFALMIGGSFENIFSQPKRLSKISIALVVAFLLLRPPVLATKNTLKKYSRGRGIEPVLIYIQAHFQSGDLIYIFKNSKVDFLYYQNRLGLKPSDYVMGISQNIENSFVSEIEELSAHKRVWFVRSTKINNNDPFKNNLKLFEYVLDKHNAFKIDSFEVNLYRCDLYIFN